MSKKDSHSQKTLNSETSRRAIIYSNIRGTRSVSESNARRILTGIRNEDPPHDRIHFER